MLHTLLFCLLYTSCMCIFEILCDIVLPRLSFQLLSQWSHFAAAAAAKSLQLCLTLWDPTDRSPPGSPVPGILQSRTLEWVAISFSNAWKWKVQVKSLSRVLFGHSGSAYTIEVSNFHRPDLNLLFYSLSKLGSVD